MSEWGGGADARRAAISISSPNFCVPLMHPDICQTASLEAHLHSAQADGAGVPGQLLLRGVGEAVVQAVLQAAAAQVAAQAAPQARHHEPDIEEQQAVYQLSLQAVQPPAASKGAGAGQGAELMKSPGKAGRGSYTVPAV